MNWGIAERTKIPKLRNGSKVDSNVGSLACESGILQVSHHAPQRMCVSCWYACIAEDFLLLNICCLCNRNGLYGSAVCAFNQEQIDSAFNGNFKEQIDTNHNWLKVPQADVPTPRPASVSRLPCTRKLGSG